MNITRQQLVTILTALATLDLWIGTGQLKVTAHMIPADWIPFVVDWATAFASILTLAATVISGGSLPPGVKTAAATVVLGALLLFSSNDAVAQIRQPPQLTGNLIADIQAAAKALPNIQTQLNDLKARMPGGGPVIKPPAEAQADLEQALAAIELVIVDDFDDAVRVFDAAKNYSGKNCFGAIRDAIGANVIANASLSKPADAPPPVSGSVEARAADLPFKHVFLAIAKLYNLMVANQPGAPIRVQCAAMKDDFKNSGPASALLGSGALSKVLPIFKLLGFVL